MARSRVCVLATSSRKQSDAPSASPFARINQLLAGTEPGKAPINLTVGEPQHAVPDFVLPALSRQVSHLNRYPAIAGTPAFRRAVSQWLQRRYGLEGFIKSDADDFILPLNGSREGLFYAAVFACRQSGKQEPVILLPNPYYHTYQAAALAAGAEPVYLDSQAQTGYLPDVQSLDKDLLRRTIGCYFASPANPQGAVADLARWHRLIELARRYGFYVFADECYSEIYRDQPPPGVLQAAAQTGSFDKVLSFNSLSKRSNLAGLRCGFVAGDGAFIKSFTSFRNVAAPQVSLIAQEVAVAAFADEAHVIENRRLYNEKYKDAAVLLGNRCPIPEGGFFLWLNVAPVGSGEAVTRRLWQEAGVRVVPGSYLAHGHADRNPGDPYIRIALVGDRQTTRDALARIASVVVGAKANANTNANANARHANPRAGA